MADYLTGVLALFDGTIRALYSVPVFAFFLSGFLAFAVLGLFLFLKKAVSGKR